MKLIGIYSTLIALFFCSINAYSASDTSPIRGGAYIGAIPISIPFDSRNGFPIHLGTWAGNVYLYKQKLEVQEWVNQQKIAMVTEALNRAKSYAKSNKYKYYAIDYIQFQIEHTENKVELFFDCNAIAWN